MGINPAALAAVIPQVTPATFQLDQSKLRVPVPKAPPPGPVAQAPSPAPSQAKEEKVEPKKKPAPPPPAAPRREDTPVREVRVEERKRNEGMRGSMRADCESNEC